MNFPLEKWRVCKALFRVNTANSILNLFTLCGGCCRNWELTGPWTGSQIKVPVKFIVGDLDLTYHVPGIKEYINSGGFKKVVPDLEVVVMEGAAHFINQEKPQEISSHIYDFIKNF